MSDEPIKPTAALGGLHEACFGVPDLASAVEYWQSYGFRSDGEGSLTASEAELLYGVASAVDSLRLRHLDSDHGLVRLMQWEKPLSTGIGLAPLRAHGSRWIAQFARNTLDISNHARVALKEGAPVAELSPSFIDLSAYNPALFGENAPKAFSDPVIAVREYTLLQPFWRQAFLQRFNYDSPLLGRIDDDALLQASQIVNASFIVTSDDPGIFDFYRDVLGLKEAGIQEIPWEEAMASRGVFELREGECHWCHTYEDPRSGSTNDSRRSGRLYIFRFPSESTLPDRLAQSQPGHLGCTLFSWRVGDAAAFRDICRKQGLSCGPLIEDEFGTGGFCCAAPDGMSWHFQQATASELERLTPEND